MKILTGNKNAYVEAMRVNGELLANSPIGPCTI